MAPKLGSDEDGDIPPCSVMNSRKSAAAWDSWKQQKYGGKQKAQPTVLRFRELHEENEAYIIQQSKLTRKKIGLWERYFRCWSKTPRPE